MKTAVIGLGRMGRNHLRAIRELGLEIAGVSDINPECLKTVSGEFSIPESRCFVAPQEMLRKARPECTVIATTADTHREFTCLAAEAGSRFILCEKPMATSVADCEEMNRACEESGARLAVHHQMRSVELFSHVRDRICDPRFGTFRSMTVVAGNIGWSMNGTHYVEFFHLLAGAASRVATGWASPERVANPRGAQFHDHAGAFRLETASGQRFYLEAGADQGHGINIIMAGSHGQIMIDELAGNVIFTGRTEVNFDLPHTRYATRPRVEIHERITSADFKNAGVLESLIGDKEVPGGNAGATAVAAVVAAIVSAEHGGAPVEIDSIDRDRKFPWA